MNAFQTVKKWDVFISHASEDKQSVARPLKDQLTKDGLKVWLDENELRLGDSLTKKIDQGLAESSYGVVILSKAFFSKYWTQRELSGLVARESTNQKVILPVWHGVDHQFIAHYSPTLADKLAVSTDRGISHVASEIMKIFDIPTAGSTIPINNQSPQPRLPSQAAAVKHGEQDKERKRECYHKMLDALTRRGIANNDCLEIQGKIKKRLTQEERWQLKEALKQQQKKLEKPSKSFLKVNDKLGVLGASKAVQDAAIPISRLFGRNMGRKKFRSGPQRVGRGCIFKSQKEYELAEKAPARRQDDEQTLGW
jgi:hypothetical protein